MIFNIYDAISYSQKYKDFYLFCNDRYNELIKEDTGGELKMLTAVQIDEYSRKALEEGLNKFFILKEG